VSPVSMVHGTTLTAIAKSKHCQRHKQKIYVYVGTNLQDIRFMGRSPGRVSGSHLEGGGRKRSFIEIKKWLEDSSEEEEEDSCEES